jgi:hypothetical protein
MPPIVAQGILPFNSNRTIRGEFPAFAFDREPNRFELQRGIDAERIVILEEVNPIQRESNLLHRPARGELRRVEVQHVLAVMQRQRIGRCPGASDLHEWILKVGREQVAASQNKRGSAIRIGSHVEHVERVADHFGFGVVSGLMALRNMAFLFATPFACAVSAKPANPSLGTSYSCM